MVQIRRLFEFRVYTDDEWARNVDDRKSTSCGTFFLGEKIIIGLSKTQSCLSQSIDEVEYVVAIINYSNIVWIKQLLEGIQEEFTKHVTIYCDNTSAINISKNHVMHAKPNTYLSSILT